MEHSTKTGLHFGLTSAVITTLGLMIGLNSATSSKLVVLGGIITIAVADAFSDALGIHISEEAEGVHTDKEVWKSTFFTWLFKFIFALTFTIPMLLVPSIVPTLSMAVMINVAWGLVLITVISFKLGKEQNHGPWRVAGEHLLVAVVVIVLTHYLGHFIAYMFG